MSIENEFENPPKEKLTLDFPGDLDQGTPVILKENGRSTVIGMFILPQVTSAAIIAQISPVELQTIHRFLAAKAAL